MLDGWRAPLPLSKLAPLQPMPSLSPPLLSEDVHCLSQDGLLCLNDSKLGVGLPKVHDPGDHETDLVHSQRCPDLVDEVGVVCEMLVHDSRSLGSMHKQLHDVFIDQARHHRSNQGAEWW